MTITTSVLGTFSTNDTKILKLRGCNDNGCVTVAEQSLILVKTQDVPFYSGQPKHISHFNGEMVYHSQRLDARTNPDGTNYPSAMYRVKRWKFYKWLTGPMVNPGDYSPIAYDVDLEDVFTTYLYQYNMDEGVHTPANHVNAIPDTSKTLFDGFSFVNNHFKVVDGGGPFASCNQMPNSFIPGYPNQTSGKNRECVNDYLDLLFGAKMSRTLEPFNGAQNGFEWFAKKHQSLLDALHVAALNSSRDIAFYLVIPSGIVDTHTTGERRKMFIDEAIEQYALWRAKYNNNSRVKLAGFYQQQESVPASTSSKAAVEFAIHSQVRAQIDSYIDNHGNELTYNSSSYNTLGTYRAPIRYSDSCGTIDADLEACLLRFTAMRNAQIVGLFDNIEFQPNASINRFHNRSPSYTHRVGDTLNYNAAHQHQNKTFVLNNYRDDTFPGDKEMLNWVNKGLFRPLSAEFRSISIPTSFKTKFGIHFEYDTLFENHTDMVNNYKITAMNGEGFYGDISRNADYMMSEFPEEYLSGPNSILYDDAGGVLYCHIKYAMGHGNVCRESDRGYGSLVSSISDVRSMYAWVNATNSGSASLRKQIYHANTQLDRSNPIQIANPSVAFDIPVNGQTRMDFQSLVRARLAEDYLHSATAQGVCNTRAKIRMQFFDISGNTINVNGGALYAEHLAPSLQCDNFLQVKQNLANKYNSVFPDLIYTKWQEHNAACGTDSSCTIPLPNSKSDIQFNIDNLKSSLDPDQWQLFPVNDIAIPAGTKRITLTLMNEQQAGAPVNVESILFYRPDYQLHH